MWRSPGELIREHLGLPGAGLRALTDLAVSDAWPSWARLPRAPYSGGRGDPDGRDGRSLLQPWQRRTTPVSACPCVRGTFPRAITAMLERGMGICQVANIQRLIPFGLPRSLGVAYALAGRIPEALPLAGAGRGAGYRYGPREQYVILDLLSQLGMGYLLIGRLEDALLSAQRSPLTLNLPYLRERSYQAHALRLLGDIHAASRAPRRRASRDPLPGVLSRWPTS